LQKTLVDRILELTEKIQQIPAPTFYEADRARLLMNLFQEENLEEVSMDEISNIYGCLRGSGGQPPIIISAHTDSVFPFETDLAVRYEDGKISGAGIGDNALGTAGLLGILWSLQEMGLAGNLPGDIWFVGNVGEEGLGDLRGMRAVVNRFGKNVLAYLVLEGMSLGQVYHRGLGVQRYQITVRTPGGHSWVDYGEPSAIHELAGVITRLTSLSLPRNPRTSLNIGVISGGTTVNTIAAEAHCEVDLRSESGKVLLDLVRQVHDVLRITNREKVQVTSTLIGLRPGGRIPASHPLVQKARKSLEELGIEPTLCIGSTDANIPLSLGIPTVCVALTRGSGAHTGQEYIYTQPLMLGIKQIIKLIGKLYFEP
jgi:acetylornithine deacetylase/succinyl-diaminopimelate desuccinylase-like protein